MATAPRPMNESRTERAERAAAQSQVWAFTVGETTYHLAPLNLPLSEKIRVQRDTGMAWEEVLRPITEGVVASATLAVLVWMARRASGEPSLAWATFAAQWDDEAMGSDLTLSIDSGDGDDPEA